MATNAHGFRPRQRVEVRGLAEKLNPCLFIGPSVSPLHPGGSHAVVHHNQGMGSVGIYAAEHVFPWRDSTEDAEGQES